MNTLVLIFFLLSCSLKKNDSVVIKGKTMGTTFSVKILNAKKEKPELEAKINEVLIEVNRQMSTYIPSSEISQFNNHKTQEPFQISNDFYYVLSVAKSVFEKSKGEFDPTVMPLVELWGFGPKKRLGNPSSNEVSEVLSYVGFDKVSLLKKNFISKKDPRVQLDLSAIAKGFGIDKVAKFLSNHSNSFLVEIGGEVYAKGVKADGSKWQVGIEAPNEKARIATKIIELDGRCIATSGDYRNYKEKDESKYSHAINLKTGAPKNNNLVSVSVLADSCVLADAFATAILVKGAQLFLPSIQTILIKKSDLN